jgi:hypothetical protein
MAKTEVATRRNTLPVDWEKQMKADAEKGRQREAAVGVSARLKTRGGILQYMDAPMPGNKMQCVILAVGAENALYDGEFDPENPASPICFAFGETDDALVPHPKSPKKQSADCASCKHNAWGSAEKGRGKACKNQRHLMLIHGDELKKAMGKGGLDGAVVVTANVPPTSLPSWAQYVKGLETNSGKPQYAFVTEVALVPDAKSQFKWQFTPVKEIEKKVMPLVFQKAKEAERTMAERPPYQPMEEAAAPGKGKGKAAKKRKF